MKKIALVLVLAVSMTACKTNKKYNADVAAAKDAGYASGYSAGQAEAESRAQKAANFMVAIQAAAGTSTISYTMVKFAKDNANYIVVSYASYYAAIDISAYTAGTPALTYLYSGISVYDKLTANGDGTYSCIAANGCLTVSGGSTVSASSSMVFEKSTASSKDLEKAAAFVEAQQVENMAAGIAAEFGLSQERSLRVAQLAASWNKLAKTRAVTDADADAFAKELTGVSMSDMASAEKAMINGSASEMNAVLSKAAAVNGTTSENMAEIMSKIFE